MNKSDPVWMRIQINKIIWIVGIWMLVSIGQFFYEYAVFAEHNFLPRDFNFSNWFWVSLIRMFAASIICAGIVVVFFEKWFRTMPFFKAFLSVLSAYTLVFLVVSFVGYSLFIGHNHKYASQYMNGWSGEFIYSAVFLKNYIFWFIAVIMTTAGLQVNDKYGPGVLKHVLIGKYFKPYREERIFMFIDLRNSTFIAERLGERAYFN